MALKIKERRNRNVKEQLKPMAPLMKAWFLQTGFELISSKDHSLTEEMLLEEFTEFFLSKIKELEGLNND